VVVVTLGDTLHNLNRDVRQLLVVRVQKISGDPRLLLEANGVAVARPVLSVGPELVKIRV
jgi:hypothetical protein